MATLSEIAGEAWGDAFAVACAIADAAVEGATGFDVGVGEHLSNAVQTGASIKEALEGDSDDGANPYFRTHQVDELDVPGHSPKTATYFRHRRLKKLGGSLFSTAGAVLGSVTQVNVLGIARHGRAEASTLAHLYRFKAMSKQVKSSQYLSNLVDVMINAKIVKAGSRGGQLAADCIPGVVPGGSIIGAVVGGAASVSGSLLMKKMSAVVSFAAIELHWRAYQETSLARTFGGSGPATRMLRELMNSPVLDKMRSGIPADVYIREPMGYLVFRDKLLLI